MKLTEVIQAVVESNPNAKQFKIETVTKPNLTKKNRTTKEPTSFTVEIRSTFTACLGVNYETEVNNLLESQGQARDFESKKPTGKHYVDGTNYLLESDTEPGKFYVAMCKFDNRVSNYYIDGQLATPEQIEDLEINYLPKQSNKLVLVEWKTYLIDSIVSIEPV